MNINGCNIVSFSIVITDKCAGFNNNVFSMNDTTIQSLLLICCLMKISFFFNFSVIILKFTILRKMAN